MAGIFSSIMNAQAPTKFTQKFLTDLGYSSVNDRPFITVLKALKFLDESGSPTQRYYDFLDEENSKIVLAQGIREAYGDLFSVNQKASEMTNEKVKGKLKSLLQGQKGPSVLTKMASTFVTLCGLADFSQMPSSIKKDKAQEEEKADALETGKTVQVKEVFSDIALKYSINIELPSTRDKLVYDAIFRSLRENLL